MKAPLKLTNCTTVCQGSALRSYSTIVQLLLRCYATADSIEKLNSEVHKLRQGLMTTGKYAQVLRTRKLNCTSVYDRIFLKALLTEGATHQICKTFLHRWLSIHTPFYETLSAEKNCYWTYEKDGCKIMQSCTPSHRINVVTIAIVTQESG